MYVHQMSYFQAGREGVHMHPLPLFQTEINKQQYVKWCLQEKRQSPTELRLSCRLTH